MHQQAHCGEYRSCSQRKTSNPLQMNLTPRGLAGFVNGDALVAGFGRREPVGCRNP